MTKVDGTLVVLEHGNARHLGRGLNELQHAFDLLDRVALRYLSSLVKPCITLPTFMLLLLPFWKTHLAPIASRFLPGFRPLRMYQLP